LERDEQIARWVELVEERRDYGVSVQDDQKLSSRGRINEGRPKSGISAASRELGIQRVDASRAIKVASLTDDAKEAAREVGLDDNLSA